MTLRQPPRLLAAIGGGHAFTVWAWIAILPFALSVIGGYDNAQTLPQRVAGVAIAFGVHLLFGAGMAIGAACERRIAHFWARLWTVIGISAALGAVRPVLIASAGKFFGLNLYSGSIAIRMATNVVAAVVIISAMAILVTGLRHRADTREQILLVSERVARQKTQNRKELSTLEAEILSPASVTVRTALRSLPQPASAPFDRIAAAERLSQIASDIVRPLSHELFASSTVEDLGPGTDRQDVTGPAGGSSTGLISSRKLFEGLRIGPATPWIPTLLYAALLLPYLSTQVETWTIASAILIGVIVNVGGNVGVRAAVPSCPAGPGIPVLLACYLLVALLDEATTRLAAAAMGGTYHFSPALLLCYPAIALTVSACQSLLQHLAELEGSLAGTLQESERSAAALRQRVFVARQRAARLLHSGVQGELTAISLRLRQQDATEQDVAESLNRIDEFLLGAHESEPPSGAIVKDQIEQLLSAWRSAMEVTLTADPGVWSRLGDEPGRAELAVDTISEALTNVLRHATTAQADITLTLGEGPPGGTVHVIVRSPGLLRAPQHDDPGYGIADLRQRALSADLHQEGANVALVVAIA